MQMISGHVEGRVNLGLCDETGCYEGAPELFHLITSDDIARSDFRPARVKAVSELTAISGLPSLAKVL